MRFAIQQLNPVMRAQAQKQLDQLRARSTEKTVVCPGPKPVACQMMAKPGVRKPLGATQLRITPEGRLAFAIKSFGLLGCERQYRWHPQRKFRSDFAFPEKRLLIEVQGGVFTNGAHTRGAGYQYDRRRNNEAVVLGWRMLEFTPDDVKSGHALFVIQRALGMT